MTAHARAVGQGVALRLGVVLLSSCAVVTEPVGEAQPAPMAPGLTGPTMVVEVTNRSRAERTIGYEFDAPAAGSSGGGEGTVGPCERSVAAYGEIAGTFEILVDRQAIHEAVVPALPDGAVVVTTIELGVDGTASVTATRIAAQAPPVVVNAIACP